MNRTLVALAALVAGGAASAQSSVTLFGVMDAAISYYNVKSAFYSNVPSASPPLVSPAGVEKSQTALSSGGYASSRLGFRGTEDLGGGLAASFWLEAGLSSDNGSVGSGSTFFTRRSTVSLSGGFGEVRMGRDYVPTFYNDSVFDPFVTSGVGTNLVSTIGSNLATARGSGLAVATDGYLRTNNSISYFLPQGLGGFYGQLQYALHENLKTSDVPGSPSKKGRYVGGRFGYANGPLNVAAAYGQSTAADTTVVSAAGVTTSAAENKISTFNLAGSYDLDVVKLFGEYSRTSDKRVTIAPLLALGNFSTTDNDKYTGGLIGVAVPIGASVIRASYSRIKFKNDLGAFVPTLFGPNNFDASADKIAIGYVYNLSKRTLLYATAARIRIKDGQNNPAVMGATTGGSPTFLATGAGTTGFAPRTATGYDFGLRHSF